MAMEFTKEKDIMEYFACGLRVRQWKTPDILAVERETWSLNCIDLKLSGYNDTKLRTWNSVVNVSQDATNTQHLWFHTVDTNGVKFIMLHQTRINKLTA